MSPRSRIAEAPRGIRTPKQARSRLTRERILAAAQAAFESRGYDETTTAAIARRAGLGVGTLYAYFPDKRALLLEILDGTVRAVSDHVIEALQPERWREGDPREHIRGVIEAVFGSRLITPGIQRILWERFFKDPEFQAAVLTIENRVREALEKLLGSLAEAGRLRPIELRAASFVIHTAVEWTASRLVLGVADVPSEAAALAATDLVARFLFEDSQETPAWRTHRPPST